MNFDEFSVVEKLTPKAFQRHQNHQNPLSIDPVQGHVMIWSRRGKDAQEIVCTCRCSRRMSFESVAARNAAAEPPFLSGCVRREVLRKAVMIFFLVRSAGAVLSRPRVVSACIVFLVMVMLKSLTIKRPSRDKVHYLGISGVQKYLRTYRERFGTSYGCDTE